MEEHKLSQQSIICSSFHKQKIKILLIIEGRYNGGSQSKKKTNKQKLTELSSGGKILKCKQIFCNSSSASDRFCCASSA
jgi:hypothetical protein